MVPAAPVVEVRFEQVAKRFGDVEVLKPLDLTIESGELLVLLGPSGCGKSTTLRMLAGLETPSSGRIHIDDRDITDSPPKDRDVAMVFQSYALYPHLSVRENLGFGLKMRKTPKPQIEQRTAEAAKMLGLEPLLDRKPKELSGGQRQRVAMGRAIVRRPKVFLFDEPLSNLDAALRTQMRAEIAALHHRLGITTVYVTHDQIEAMTLASRIVILDGGVVQQVGPPLSVYEKPKNGFVGRFLGSPAMNEIPGKIVDGPRFSGEGIDVALSADRGAHVGREVVLGIRPQALTLTDEGIAGTVEIVEPTGGESYVRVAVGSLHLTARVEGSPRLAIGEAVKLSIDTASVHVFARGPDGVAAEVLA